ncbi:muramoyltetrapeptide carboxypeptidase LdcA involved in peptidoglycan recycling [Krasilnikovia cinnamomea]|uniref:Muramoyltetrapeptide carboxypeptidase LdcA involved in peptidoglycan recycling n=1 Tax=Krasilnikovia cinnamomea TaxID=349313 RepID=A0A4Q7ZM79_9ACTN|nr:S66 peptidase family protein [Krasilnikovia cinnamomea]RZU51731.1 muramoyltetrapeptide carboxypeptidase LdcA involved in peptidoglycan recycling [Krasilnikovia cinnamomea]
MRPTFRTPPKLSPGDRVAVVSPSFAAPAEFPDLHEQAMRRLRDDFGLEPVEYPTTRQLGAAPAERARDLMAAYADPGIRAVLATIGGDDQITVLPHLDPAPFQADPKPFFGYSDNTNLLIWLWHHGVAAYHGGSTMVHVARGAGPHPVSAGSLRAALFTPGDLEITPVEEFSDEELSWHDPASLTSSLPHVPSPGWVWHQPDRVVTAPTWGGNLEILHWQLAADRWIRPVDDYAGCVLLLETSEEMPPDTEVFRILRNAGERGLLAQFPAILVGTAKASSFSAPRPPEERARYRDEQREAVLRALRDYHPEAMVVFGVDFGHTDPQWILPYGGSVTVDGPARRITAHL